MKRTVLKVAFSGMFVLLFTLSGSAQFLLIDGTYSRPESFAGTGSFRDVNGTGLYAKNGGGLNLEALKIYNVVGIGGSFSFSLFGMKDELLMQDLGAVDLRRSGSVSSVKFAFGPVLQVPLIADRVFWNVKLYGGFRFLTVPNFTAFMMLGIVDTLKWNTNPKGNVGVHYEVGSGFTVMINEQLGVNLGASYIQGPITRIGYDIHGRGTKAYEGNDELYQSVNYLNFRVGLAIRM